MAVAWGEFERAQRGLAEAGRVLLYQYGVGLAFLATVRADGGIPAPAARLLSTSLTVVVSSR